MGILEKFGFGTPKPQEQTPPPGSGYEEELKLGKFTPTEAEIAKALAEGGETAVLELRKKFDDANRKKQAAAGEKMVKETGDAISKDIEGGSAATH